MSLLKWKRDTKRPKEGSAQTVQAEQEKSEKSEWISIDEKEPPLSSCVLTYYKCSENFYTMEVLYYGFLDGKNRFFTFDISSGEEIYKPFVTHWMPLPKPPEDVK